MSKIPKHTLVYLGSVERYDREKQLDLCHEIVEKLNLAPFKNKVYEHNELGEYISAMRGNEVALVPFLRSLSVKPGAGVGTRFYINERALNDACDYIVSLNTGKSRAIADCITLQSDSGSEWYELLAKTGRSVMKGQKLKTTTAKTMANKRRSKAGLADAWKLNEGTAEYISVASIWGNLNIRPAEKAISMFPDEELSKASKSTVERAMGTRAECLEWLDKYL